MLRVINIRLRHSEILFNTKIINRSLGIGKLLDDLEQNVVKSRKFQLKKTLPPQSAQSQTQTRTQTHTKHPANTLNNVTTNKPRRIERKAVESAAKAAANALFNTRPATSPTPPTRAPTAKSTTSSYASGAQAAVSTAPSSSSTSNKDKLGAAMASLKSSLKSTSSKISNKDREEIMRNIRQERRDVQGERPKGHNSGRRDRNNKNNRNNSHHNMAIGRVAGLADGKALTKREMMEESDIIDRDRRYERYLKNKTVKREEFEKKWEIDKQNHYSQYTNNDNNNNRRGGQKLNHLNHQNQQNQQSQDDIIEELKTNAERMRERLAARKEKDDKKNARFNGARNRNHSNHNNIQGGDGNEEKVSSKVRRVQERNVQQVVIDDKFGISIRDLSISLGVNMNEIRDTVSSLGDPLKLPSSDSDYGDIMLEPDIAELIVLELGVEVKRISRPNKYGSVTTTSDCRYRVGDVVSRSPVICIMGHVDHGKTTLLDSLRSMSSDKSSSNKKIKKSSKKNNKGNNPGNSTDVAGTEEGGITQKISAFTVAVPNPDDSKTSSSSSGKKEVVFLDTPGHEAFKTMRSFGAHATDIVVLVVAIDDGVRPQTIESIKIAQSAGCSVVIAVNKVDKYEDETERASARLRLLTSLSEHDILPEEFGGEVQVVDVSGKTGLGLDSLLESLSLQADLLDLKAHENGLAEATVLESRIERGRGVVTDLLLRSGRLSIGDNVVVGTSYGKVKALFNSEGKSIKSAVPPYPVRMLGLRELPDNENINFDDSNDDVAAVELLGVESEVEGRDIIERRQRVVEMRALVADAQVKALKAASDEAITSALGVTTYKIPSKINTSYKRLRRGQKRDQRAMIREALEAAEVENAALRAHMPRIVTVLKADSSGTLAALRTVVDKVISKAEEDVDIQVVAESIGDISLNDVQSLSGSIINEINPTSMSSSSNTSRNASNPAAVAPALPLILGFNVNSESGPVRDLAKRSDITVKTNGVVYRLEEELLAKIHDLLPKETVKTVVGEADVLQIFELGDKHKSVVAGMSVGSGHMRAEDQHEFVLVRDAEMNDDEDDIDFNNDNKIEVASATGTVASLRRFKDNVTSVASGQECGLIFPGYRGVKVGDRVLCYKLSTTTKKITMEENR